MYKVQIRSLVRLHGAIVDSWTSLVLFFGPRAESDRGVVPHRYVVCEDFPRAVIRLGEALVRGSHKEAQRRDASDTEARQGPSGVEICMVE